MTSRPDRHQMYGDLSFTPKWYEWGIRPLYAVIQYTGVGFFELCANEVLLP
jgi:hypothetical protein